MKDMVGKLVMGLQIWTVWLLIHVQGMNILLGIYSTLSNVEEILKIPLLRLGRACININVHVLECM